MKKPTSLILLLLFSLSVFAGHHKTTVKDGKILVEGKAIAKIEKVGCKTFSTVCKFYISNLQGERLITVMVMSYDDPNKVTQYNTKGLISYLRFSFVGYSKMAEAENPAAYNTKPKQLARIIVNSDLIKDGKLNKPAVLNFIKINGTHFSDRQKALNNQPKVIINVNNGK